MKIIIFFLCILLLPSLSVSQIVLSNVDSFEFVSNEVKKEFKTFYDNMNDEYVGMWKTLDNDRFILFPDGTKFLLNEKENPIQIYDGRVYSLSEEGGISVIDKNHNVFHEFNGSFQSARPLINGEIMASDYYELYGESVLFLSPDLKESYSIRPYEGGFSSYFFWREKENVLGFLFFPDEKDLSPKYYKVNLNNHEILLEKNVSCLQGDEIVFGVNYSNESILINGHQKMFILDSKAEFISTIKVQVHPSSKIHSIQLNNQIYFIDTNNRLVCYNSKTYDALWSKQVSGSNEKKIRLEGFEVIDNDGSNVFFGLSYSIAKSSYNFLILNIDGNDVYRKSIENDTYAYFFFGKKKGEFVLIDSKKIQHYEIK